MATAKKLYRSKTERVFAGICGGLGKYLSVDPVVVRLGWIVFGAITGGLGILAYIIAIFVIPEEPNNTSIDEGKENS
jgi:phage shock protein C